MLSHTIMNTNYLSAKHLSERLGLHKDVLRRMAKDGKIKHYRTPGGHYRYAVDDFTRKSTEPAIDTIGYCRVSGRGQSDALASQVAYVQGKYPSAEIIKDFGSGINFKCQGVRTLLERILRGDKLRVVVAHRDRLARFGGEVIQYLIEQNGGEVVVLDETVYSPEAELTVDLLAIRHVFSCRMYGLRKYRDQIKEDRDISNSGAEAATQ